MPTTTPYGTDLTMRCSFVSSGANMLPTWARSKVAWYSKKPAAASPTSPRASVIVFPCSATTSCASSSCRARIPSAIALSTLPRSTPVFRVHSLSERLAASSALCARPASASGTSTMEDSSAGFISGLVSLAVTHEPLMYIAGSLPSALKTSIQTLSVGPLAGQVGLRRDHHDQESARHHLLGVRG